MAITHVLEPWGMSFVLGICVMRSDLIIKGLTSRVWGTKPLSKQVSLGGCLASQGLAVTKTKAMGPPHKRFVAPQSEVILHKHFCCVSFALRHGKMRALKLSEILHSLYAVVLAHILRCAPS